MPSGCPAEGGDVQFERKSVLGDIISIVYDEGLSCLTFLKRKTKPKLT
jgi:hypothetical protein